MNMEIKIPKEVRQHSETIFFGLSTRQFICAVLAVSVAIGTYFLTKGVLAKKPPAGCASWPPRRWPQLASSAITA